MKVNLKSAPKVGDTRIVKKFAWFPITLEDQDTNQRIFIWWEFYYKHQYYAASTYVHSQEWITKKITLSI